MTAFTMECSKAPGSHVLVLTDQPDVVGVAGRTDGLHLRDTIVIWLPGPRVLFGLLFRHELGAPTLIENLLTYGEGALHIDACRVQADPDDVGDPDRWYKAGTSDYFRQGGWYRPYLEDVEDIRVRRQAVFQKMATLGRWPANLAIVHSPECKQVGTREVKTRKMPDVIGERPTGFVNVGSGKGSHNPNAACYGGEDGKETIPSWECATNCPAYHIDAQSEAASRYYPQFTDFSSLLDWLGTLISPEKTHT